MKNCISELSADIPIEYLVFDQIQLVSFADPDLPVQANERNLKDLINFVLLTSEDKPDIAFNLFRIFIHADISMELEFEFADPLGNPW